MKLNYKLNILAMAFVLAACGTTQTRNEIKRAQQPVVDRSGEEIQRTRERIQQPVDDSEVARPYVVGRSIPVSREVTVPQTLRKSVKLERTCARCDEGMDLQSAAAQLSKASSIQIRVLPDALQPASAFLPKAGGAAPSVAPQIGAPANPADRITLRLLGDTSLAEELDRICQLTSTSWRWTGSAVEIYRVVTKAIELRTTGAKSGVQTALGRGGASNLDATAKATSEFQAVDEVQSIKSAVESMLTRGGLVVAAGTTLTVTDTQESVDRVSAFVDTQNKFMARRIEVVIDRYDVVTSESDALGLNWSVVAQRLQQATGGALTLTRGGSKSPSSGVDASAGITTLEVQGASPFSGSQLVANALAQSARIVKQSQVVLMGQNRTPLQHVLRKNFDYVQSITVNTVASAAGTSTAPTINQKEESVGTVITLTPVAWDNGVINLSLQYDETALTSLKPYAVNGGSAQATATVQQREVDQSAWQQAFSLRSGQPVIVSGLLRSEDSFATTRNDRNLPLVMGGSDTNSRRVVTTVLIISTRSTEGL